jgi:hypothetical protein
VMGTDRSSDQAGFWGRHENVYIYIPNLIGRPPTHTSVASQMYTLTNSNIAVRCETENSAHVLAIKLFLTFRRAATGYGRVLIMLISFTIARTAPLTCVGLYFLGSVPRDILPSPQLQKCPRILSNLAAS